MTGKHFPGSIVGMVVLYLVSVSDNGACAPVATAPLSSAVIEDRRNTMETSYSISQKSSSASPRNHSSMNCGVRMTVDDVTLGPVRRNAESNLNRRTRRQVLEDAPRLKIGVVWQVIHDGSVGNVSLDRLQRQTTILSQSFAGEQGSGAVDAKMSFYIAYVRRTDSAVWYADCYDLDETIKGALAVSPTRFVNMYSCGNLGKNQLGWAVFPWWSSSLGSKYYGVFLADDIIPSASGPLTGRYNGGDVAVHELGHLFGLLHTFQDGPTSSGCVVGDFVEDTPAESSAHYGCTQGNSCTSDDDYFIERGLDFRDPLWNFMSYGDGTCMVRFTPLQVDRMRVLTSAYYTDLETFSQGPESFVPSPRPGLHGTATCGSTFAGTTTFGSSYGIGGLAGEHIYTFVAPVTGSYILNSCGSAFDTWLRVFSADLSTEIAECDDCGPCGSRSVLSTVLAAGTAYNVVVEGWGSMDGSYTVSVTCPPGAVSVSSAPTALPTTPPYSIALTSVPDIVVKSPGVRVIFPVTVTYSAPVAIVDIIVIVREAGAPGQNFEFRSTLASGGDLNNLPGSGTVAINVRLVSRAPTPSNGYSVECWILPAGQGWSQRQASTGSADFLMHTPPPASDAPSPLPTNAPTPEPVGVSVVAYPATVAKQPGQKVIFPITVRYNGGGQPVDIIVQIFNTHFPGESYEFRSRRTGGGDLTDLPSSGLVDVDVRMLSSSPVPDDGYTLQIWLVEAGHTGARRWDTRFASSDIIRFATATHSPTTAPTTQSPSPSSTFTELLPPGCCRTSSGSEGSGVLLLSSTGVPDCQAQCLRRSASACAGVEHHGWDNTCEIHPSAQDFHHTAPVTDCRCFRRDGIGT
eukprot:m.543534 g.543534  ORF g.543534 m.543534 type:complete len:856 (+) comp22130_c0_seq2:292-2859(+)